MRTITTAQRNAFLELLSRLNPLLGNKKWNWGGANPRTFRRHFEAGTVPTGMKAKEIGESIWQQIQGPRAAGIRSEVLRATEEVVPAMKGASWTRESFTAAFYDLAERIRSSRPVGDDAPRSQSADLEGSLQVLVWDSRKHAYVPIEDSGKLPLHAGDRIQVSATLSANAYPHVVWIDGEGKAVPIHPWKNKTWKQFEPTEPSRELRLPRADTSLSHGHWAIGPASGAETVLLMADATPIARDILDKLPSLFNELPRRIHLEVPEQVYRFPAPPLLGLVDAEPITEPIAHLHQALCDRLSGRFSLVCGLSFAVAGQKKKQRRTVRR